MMSSQPTTQPQMYETILNPYPRSHVMVPGSQQPVSFIHLGNQAQSGQPPFFGSPGIITNSQQGPVNTQVVNPATGTETTNFREDAKILGFITTGTLSILASKKLSPSLIKSSLGMNIVSTFFAFIGVILLLVDVSINGLPNQDYWAVLSGKGIAAMLIIFSLLEFCTNCTTAYFAKQAITKTNRPVLVIPNMYEASPLEAGFSAPPRKDGYFTYST
uniref:Membrane spanning 4-domains A12 n=1 Tax=Ailuropoda melanoleuca TaxID=9646 RepID=A0A7N5KEJ6_AILME